LKELLNKAKDKKDKTQEEKEPAIDKITTEYKA